MKINIVYRKRAGDYQYSLSQEGGRLPVSHCVKDSNGAKIDIRVYDENSRAHRVCHKATFGCPEMVCYISFEECFRDEMTVEEIELVGVCTDICVISNAFLLKTYFPEARIIIDASCCAGVTPESHKTALAAMKACQMDIIGEDI
jgi:Amidases related to nicotinamidase